MPTTRSASVQKNGKASPEATRSATLLNSEATLAEVLLDAASKVDDLLQRNEKLERENADLKHDLASARTQADDVRREALARVEEVLAKRGMS